MKKGYWILLLFCYTTLQSCHQQKELTDNRKTRSIDTPKTLPGTVAMAPSTFSVEAIILSVVTIESPSTGGNYYKANILLNAITGRGSSLVEIVSAGDTINCSWPTYHADDKSLTDNIANRKLMEVLIEERAAMPVESFNHFVIQTCRFK